MHIFRLRIQIKTGHFFLLREDIFPRTLKVFVYSKKFTKTQFFSLCTDILRVLCTQKLRNNVCELCSVRYVRVCIHLLYTCYNKPIHYLLNYSDSNSMMTVNAYMRTVTALLHFRTAFDPAYLDVTSNLRNEYQPRSDIS